MRTNASTLGGAGNSELDHLLTEAELACRWGVSPKTLRNARVTGSPVPFVRIGRLIRYPLSGVLAYEQRRTRNSTSS